MSDIATATASAKPVDMWLTNRLEELALDLGRLRRGTRDTEYEWNVERVADRVYTLMCHWTPTAADLVRDGCSVPQALMLADRETRRLRRLLGERANV